MTWDASHTHPESTRRYLKANVSESKGDMGVLVQHLGLSK